MQPFFFVRLLSSLQIQRCRELEQDLKNSHQKNENLRKIVTMNLKNVINVDVYKFILYTQKRVFHCND
jgi:hypothetical protein